jgi:hypothetical protein
MSKDDTTCPHHRAKVVCDTSITAGTYELLSSPALWGVEGYDKERPVVYWWGALWGSTSVQGDQLGRSST